MLLELDTYVVTDATEEGQNDGAIELGLKGGTPPYLVTWSNGGIGDTITGLAPGAYDYTITDAHGCQIISWIPIIVSLITKTDQDDAHTLINIIPNPSNGQVFIEWNGITSGIASLTLMTMDGKTLDVHQLHTKDGMWDLTSLDLPGGLYLIMLKQDNKVFLFKLVVL